MTTTGGLELSVLLAVARAGAEAYGLAIRRDLAERLHRDYSVGAIYTALDRLEAKGLVASRSTEPMARRGGRSRRVFHVTDAGSRAIRDARDAARSTWADVRDGVITEGS